MGAPLPGGSEVGPQSAELSKISKERSGVGLHSFQMLIALLRQFTYSV